MVVKQRLSPLGKEALKLFHNSFKKNSPVTWESLDTFRMVKFELKGDVLIERTVKFVIKEIK